MTEDLNTRVENAAQGITPQTKPDERRQYLGSLRERVLLRMNNSEVKDPNLTRLFLDHILDYRGYTILINGKMSADDFLGKIEASCSQNNIPFTLVNNETAKTGNQDTAILVVANAAINKMRIEIGQVYPPEMPKTQLEQPQKKTGFWHRLLHGDN
ncbi:YueI family protein [Lactobacillus sp. ESL0791]|uniref:YueI family protein n=1 Tax=Lactobacillus sp. ESL0791 TaxID=2983234 RepID=UPI0023F9C2C1|nr:YueI family protein [Lactobacillus sp. ESL0791]MDF7638788.1 YueI family protein [Lactobacillus sp. ESL0791]